VLGARSFTGGVSPQLLLTGTNYLFGKMQVASSLAGHLPLELSIKGLLDIAEEFLKLGIVNAGLLSSFHGPSNARMRVDTGV